MILKIRTSGTRSACWRRTAATRRPRLTISNVSLQSTPEIPVRFVDVTKTAGIITRAGHTEFPNGADIFGKGACFLDFDGDGKIDIYLANDGNRGGQSLYRNLGNGSFSDVTSSVGLDSN